MVTRHTMTTSLSPGIDNARDGNIILAHDENKNKVLSGIILICIEIRPHKLPNTNDDRTHGIMDTVT